MVLRKQRPADSCGISGFMAMIACDTDRPLRGRRFSRKQGAGAETAAWVAEVTACNGAAPHFRLL
jgi:hypothetical protein